MAAVASLMSNLKSNCFPTASPVFARILSLRRFPYVGLPRVGTRRLRPNNGAGSSRISDKGGYTNFPCRFTGRDAAVQPRRHALYEALRAYIETLLRSPCKILKFERLYMVASVPVRCGFLAVGFLLVSFGAISLQNVRPQTDHSKAMRVALTRSSFQRHFCTNWCQMRSKLAPFFLEGAIL